MGNDNEFPAADPPSDHATPGANPVNDQSENGEGVTTQVETPGGTKVSEQAEGAATADTNSVQAEGKTSQED